VGFFAGFLGGFTKKKPARLFEYLPRFLNHVIYTDNMRNICPDFTRSNIRIFEFYQRPQRQLANWLKIT